MTIDEWDKDKVYVYYNEIHKSIWLCTSKNKLSHLGMLLFFNQRKNKVVCHFLNIDWLAKYHYIEIGEL